tara:strand:+ start:9928 stop:10686 length:759 start_codon:yes stop_codon:yes gene_type:complete
MVSQLISKLAIQAAKAASTLLKKPSIMVDDTKKFAGKFGKKLAEEHLGKDRVKKATASTAKKAQKKKPAPKPKSKKKFTKKDLQHMSKEERKEFSKLRKQQEADMRGEEKTTSTSGGDRQQMLIRQGRRKSPFTGEAIPRGSNPPKVKYPRQKRSIVEDPRGELKSKSRLGENDMREFNPKEKMEEKLRPMPPGTADQTFEAMKGKGMGRGQLEDIMDQVMGGGLTLKKKGGKVGSPRGIGKALRGFGKVTL